MTGAAGLTGAQIIAGLVRRGHRVTGLVRRAEAMPEIAALGASPALGECSDEIRMRALLHDVDGLIHVAGIRLGAQIASAGIGHLARVVVLSTAGIYSRFRSSAEEYRRNEDAIREGNPGSLFVRPTMIYGSPRDRNVHYVIRIATKLRALPVPMDRGRLVQPVHYQDLAEATVVIFDTSASGVVDAGGPTPMTLRDAARIVLLSAGLRPVLIPVPLGPAAAVAGVVDLFGGRRLQERVLRMTEDRTVNNARLLELTGMALRPFADGVRQEVSAMRRVS